MVTLISIEDARKKLGGISRTTFYVTILPKLEAFAASCNRPAATKKLGRRRMVYLSVLEAFMLAVDKIWWFFHPPILWHLGRIVYVPIYHLDLLHTMLPATIA